MVYVFYKHKSMESLNAVETSIPLDVSIATQ